MLPVTIEKQITIAAKATTIWRFISTEEGLRQWWGLDIMLEAKPGGRCEERGHWQGRHRCWRGTVTTYNPPYQLSLFLRNVDEKDQWPAWVTISLCLTESQGQTLVTLVQQAFEPVSTETALGQVATQPLTATTPHTIWNRLSPQNALSTAFVNTARFPYATSDAFSSMTQSWLMQQENSWQTRLQHLAEQVLLALPVAEN